MSFFITSSLLNIKKFAAQKAVWFGLIILPLALSLGGMSLRSGITVVEVTAGVYFNHENELEAHIFEILESVTTAFVRFTAYDDQEALLEDVRLGRIECGYILHITTESAVQNELRESVTLVSSPRTVAAPVLNEIVAAAILRAATPELTKAGLEAFFSGNTDIAEFVEWQFDAYAEMDIFMSPAFTGQAGFDEQGAPNISDITASRIFHGLIGLTILALLLFCIPIFIEERHSGLPIALRACGKLGLYYASLWAAALAASFTIGLAGLCAIAVFAPHLLAQTHVELAALIGYAAVCSALMVLLACRLHNAHFVQSFGLFIIILNIFFGGVLLNLAEISPSLAYLQLLFPLYWYVEAIIQNYLTN